MMDDGRAKIDLVAFNDIFETPVLVASRSLTEKESEKIVITFTVYRFSKYCSIE